MVVPSARKLFRTYVVLLALIALSALAVQALVHGSQRRADAPWLADDDAAGTAVSFRGPDPRTLLGAGDARGSALYYGPLAAGECLPPIDVVGFRPRFEFHGAGVVFNTGFEDDGALQVIASSTSLPERFAERATYVQVCFPSGVDHTQYLWIEARRAGAAASPFLGRPRIPPPPLTRVPARVVVNTSRGGAAYLAVGGQEVFSSVGRECVVRISDERPIVIELGELGEDWKFVPRETLRVAGGEIDREPERVRWAHFRVHLPEGGTRARLSLTAEPEA